MAYKRDAKPAAAKVDYQPYEWVQTSGDIETDALFVCGLATIAQRRHELWRLGFFHGRHHVAMVEQRVRELWPQRAEMVAAQEAEAKKFWDGHYAK